MHRIFSVVLLSVFLVAANANGQEAANTRTGKPVAQNAKAKAKAKAKRKPAPFKWVNELKADYPGVQHATFCSESMNLEVGYCIYLPPSYKTKTSQRYPVVYYLHGGRPGSETKSVKLVQVLHEHISQGRSPEVIYVFVNGGPVSHYNMPDRDNAMGADVFVKELIPHVDQTYRTIAERSGRGLEGFSQGGRGTTRIGLRYPKMFCSIAPGGAGHATEKRISEENGRESESLVFQPGDNTYDLARAYAKRRNAGDAPNVPIQIHVGTEGFNYENNLAYMTFLDELKIPYQKVIVRGAEHSAMQIYQKRGLDIMQFHAKNFGLH